MFAGLRDNSSKSLRFHTFRTTVRPCELPHDVLSDFEHYRSQLRKSDRFLFTLCIHTSDSLVDV